MSKKMNLSILDEILKEVPANTETEQIREICKQIQEEEDPKIEHRDKLPSGPNVFLSLEVPGRREGEISYISLERESQDKYLAVYRTIFKKYYNTEDVPAKRVKVFEINQFSPKKVMVEFAKYVKLMRGE